jgi:hypothetical protein
MAYSDKVVEHYNNPRNVGSLPKEDPNVGTGLVGAPECGDVMKLQMKINPDTKVIEEAKFKTFGCGSAIASAQHQEHRHRARAFASAGQDSLLGARGRRHQGCHRRLEEKAWHRSAGSRKGRALIRRARFRHHLLVGAQDS